MMFTEIDLNNWSRGQMFYYFSKMAPTGYSITVKLDVTKMREVMRKRKMKMKFFPAYLWIVTKNLNKQIEFKVAEQDGKLGYFDVLTPMYASFHGDDKTFSFMWTEYSESFLEFYNKYLENQRKYSENHGVLAQPTPPKNAYTISCIPWISFEHFAVHSYENKPYYFPSIESGKFIEQEGKILMPLSITCHHATTDGYHVDKFLRELQISMDCFEEVI